MTFPYKKALVTGGAGFIGSHLVEALVEMGVETISIDDYSTGKLENLVHLISKPNFREVICDVRDADSLKEHFDGVDIVFHHAATKKTVCLLDPQRDLETNAGGTLNVLNLSHQAGVRKFVHASTGSIYGEGRCFPQNEAHPLAPISFYGASKLAGEGYINAFNYLYDLDATILRYFHVYGPRQESSDYGGVVAIFIRRLLNGQAPIIFGDGTQQRSFTYVKDVVRANLHVAATPGTKGEVYNCASGIRVTINELAHSLMQLMGRDDLHPMYRDWQPGDIRIFDVDNSKLRATGFEFQTPFEEGLKRTIEYYENVKSSIA
jgi:UDP-glucose 4-epimerase